MSLFDPKENLAEYHTIPQNPKISPKIMKITLKNPKIDQNDQNLTSQKPGYPENTLKYAKNP